LADVTEAVATAGAAANVRRGLGTAKLGWTVFALTSAALVSALALDLYTGTYNTLIYLGASVVLALIGLLLTTRRPEHPVSWILAITAFWGVSVA
jgi:hypothetical protein